MPKCPKCGAENKEGDKFCFKCGANITPKPAIAASAPAPANATHQTNISLPIDPKILIALVAVIIIVIVAIIMSSSSSQGPFSEAKQASEQIDFCMDDVENLIMTEQYDEVSQKALSCKQYSTAYSQALDRIDPAALNAEQYDELLARRLEPEVADSIFDAMYYVGIIAPSTGDDIDKFTSNFEDFVSSMDTAIYYIYRMKVEHPKYYSSYLATSGTTEDELLLEFANLYQIRNEFVNTMSQNDLYSYFYNVDPQDKAVVYVTDKLLDGILDDEARKQTLLDFVRKNIDYKHDPNWYQDWPMPPAYTLLAGTGDCDDMAILLSSMMKRAGVANVELCLADSTPPYDDGYDHMTVGINAGDGWWIYEPTCDSCTEAAPDDVNYWSVSCSGIEEFFTGSDEQSDLDLIYAGNPIHCLSEVSDENSLQTIELWMQYPLARMNVSMSVGGSLAQATILKEFGVAVYVHDPYELGPGWYEIPEGDDLDIPYPEDIINSGMQCEYVDERAYSFFMPPENTPIVPLDEIPY